MSSKILSVEKIQFLGLKGMPATVSDESKMPDTGSWKVFRPVIDYNKCIKCHLCWLHCPDAAIKIRADEFIYSDYSVCKGCGACSEVCPVKCIQMQRSKPDKVARSDLIEFKKETEVQK